MKTYKTFLLARNIYTLIVNVTRKQQSDSLLTFSELNESSNWRCVGTVSFPFTNFWIKRVLFIRH
jgi:hypothetical protein